ncbi:diaminopimelate decarboxylase [Streptomyces acidiscabies]|uniref:Diaminopimelate decarboxylase n=1 Tax=Streptomyces acidiscabies TaxID=42234 RepID=A0A0L0K7W0_9ACTN|nr:diaminopimelate decarboxylase [Streptomyces acidiscabies]
MNRVHEYALGLSAGELPSYVYDLAALREHAAAVRGALPSRVEVYYAAKANPEAEILAALGAYVDGYEVSSGGELAHVARAVPGRALAFGGPGKTPDEVRGALDAGVERFHVESEYELAMLAALAGGRRVSVLPRVNLAVPDGALTGSQLAMGGRPTPFGMDPSRAAVVARGLASGAYGNLELVGVHAHLASGLDTEAQVAVAGAVVEWATGIGVPLAEVNVGGGMAVDYGDPESRFDWVAYGKGLGEIADAHPELTLRIEPGRALTAYCGWYVTEVLDVKRSHGEEFAVVRGGTHHLRTPATKGHDQPCVVLPVEEWAHPWPRAAASGELVTLAGQLCTPKDLLARGVAAGGLRAGDRVAFSMAGAYAWNISHHEFLMHPRPGFHFLR